MCNLVTYMWHATTVAVFFGYILIKCESLKSHSITNLFLFGKLRNLREFNVTSGFLQVPKRWFWHFYGAGLVVHTTLLIVTVYSVFIADKFPANVSLILSYVRTPASDEELLPPALMMVVLVMGEVQMMRRLFECLCTNSYSASSMSIPIYLTGISFYCAQGVSLLCLMQEESLTVGDFWKSLNWWHYLLIAMFIYFSYKQHVLFNILASLRRNKEGVVVTDRHLLPKGDLFQYSSCPHYFMEILIYIIYCAMFWWRHPVCNAIALFVLVNQLIAGHLAHQWYLETFRDYPKDRAPVIPFLRYDRLNTPPPKKTQ
ncbi:polyprenal reductase-like [Crassostrea virginica]